MGLSISFNVDNATVADLKEMVTMAERMGISSDTYLEFDDASRHLRVDSDGLNESKAAEIRKQQAEEALQAGKQRQTEENLQTEVDAPQPGHPRDGGEWSDVFDRVTRSVNNNPVTQQIGDAAMRSLGDFLSGRRNPPRY
ncbi:hypothetical protein [Corynebacterium sp.]|uniref:hypothetical protein n=1 Tax=Corynebacterium sp. TaxID=1720 RepID=UPI0027B96F5D|nr:hypothetical protein [Corynebacterium sp.]